MTNSATILGGIAGTSLTSDERDFFRSADPWGFILFGRNVESPDQLRRLTSNLRDAVGRDAVITIDQEGGRVQRMRAPHWLEWSAPLDQSGAGERAMWLRYRLIGAELRDGGIDSNCAPTLDVAQTDTHPFLRNRCLGTDADMVVALGRAAADGLLAAGVLPIIKHMPGHGRAVADSHHDLPRVTASLDALDVVDFAPFRGLSDLPMGMTGHILFAELDDKPATSSAKIISLIRNRLGFDGLLMTDDIGMNALPGSEPERAAAAMSAGCDLVLHCNGDISTMEPVVAEAGVMTPAAQRRATRAIEMRHTPETADLKSLLAEYQDLVPHMNDGLI